MKDSISIGTMKIKCVNTGETLSFEMAKDELIIKATRVIHQLIERAYWHRSDFDDEKN